MSEERKDEEVVLEEKQEDDLDSWFGDDEEEEYNYDIEDEDQSAEEDATEEEESSASEDEEEPAPDNEDQSEDAAVAASEEGTSTEEQSEGIPYELMEALDPDLRAKVEELVKQNERLSHSDQSNRGRVAALQRRLDSIQAEQDARARTQPQTAADVAAITGKKIEDMDDDELKEFMEEFPTVGRNVEKMIERRLNAEIEKRIQPLEQARLQEKFEQDRYQLRQEAQRIFNTVETGIDLDDVVTSRAFKDWLAEQPTEYQRFAQTAESVPAAAKVLTDFAMYTEEQVAAMMEYEDSAAKQQQKQETSRSADQTAARRKQARQGATPKSKSAQLSNKPGQGTYEDWFDHFANGGN